STRDRGFAASSGGPAQRRRGGPRDRSLDPLIMQIRDTRYVRTPDGVCIAYQVAGEGSIDLAWGFDFTGNVDLAWEWPVTGPLLRALAATGRGPGHRPVDRHIKRSLVSGVESPQGDRPGAQGGRHYRPRSPAWHHPI